MADEKPKRKTHTSSAVKDRYNAKAYDDLRLRVPKGKKADLQEHAAGRGESLNGFLNRAIDSQIAQDNAVTAFTIQLGEVSDNE